MSARPTFDAYMMAVAHLVAARGTCDRARVGCVLVQGRYIIATGYNGALSGAPHCDDAGHLLRDGHCIRTVHAEQNAVAQAAQHGARTAGATAYITHAPCHSCAKLLAAAGVVEVVIGAPYGGNGGIELLQAAAVLVRAAEMGETNDIL